MYLNTILGRIATTRIRKYAPAVTNQVEIYSSVRNVIDTSTQNV